MDKDDITKLIFSYLFKNIEYDAFVNEIFIDYDKINKYKLIIDDVEHTYTNCH